MMAKVSAFFGRLRQTLWNNHHVSLRVLKGRYTVLILVWVSVWVWYRNGLDVGVVVVVVAVAVAVAVAVVVVVVSVVMGVGVGVLMNLNEMRRMSAKQISHKYRFCLNRHQIMFVLYVSYMMFIWFDVLCYLVLFRRVTEALSCLRMFTLVCSPPFGQYQLQLKWWQQKRRILTSESSFRVTSNIQMSKKYCPSKTDMETLSHTIARSYNILVHTATQPGPVSVLSRTHEHNKKILMSKYHCQYGNRLFV